jgi:hypothetical protein
VAHVHGFNPPVISELQTFEAILYDPLFNPTTTGDGEIVYQYNTVFNDDTLSSNCHDAATVGIAGDIPPRGVPLGLQVTFADSLSPASAALAPGRAIKFTTDPPDTFAGMRSDPSSLRLAACGLSLDAFPTPNHGTFTVRYALGGSGTASLRLYDVTGNLVSTLVSGYHPAGSYSYSLLTTHGSLASGVYLLNLTLNQGGRIIPLARKLVVSQ